MNRREMLKTMAVAGAASALPFTFAQPVDARRRLLDYLETHARADGGYGWELQEHSHLTPTFYVIGCYRVLEQEHPGAARLADFVRTHHPGALKKLEQERRIFDWQQVQALVWLGADPSALKARIIEWKKPLEYLKQYERHGYPLFSSEMGVILSRALLGVPSAELPADFVDYLDSRRRANGSFNNTPAMDSSGGHVLNTWWGLQALAVFGRASERADQTIAWLRSCQVPSGGFTYAPSPEFGGVDDVAYTWAALRSLKRLGSGPVNRSAAIKWIESLANADGGFGDRPGWFSNPMATYYALDALKALDALDHLQELPAAAKAPRGKPGFGSSLRVFSIQLEAHGRGSPSEAVELARALRIHLWGAKNAAPGWIDRAQAVAEMENVPVRFFVSNEEYGTWVDIPGQGTYSHTSDIIAPADAQIGPSIANRRAASWAEFRETRLAPLEAAGGRLVWQFGENEELVRMFLDDSVARGGFAGISTYHFGNPDFTNSEPFLHRWRGRIPFVALQDAHGPEPWWFADMTTAFRTLFVAEEPSWDAWLDALKNNRVAAVRRDEWTKGKTWMHAPTRELFDFIRARELEWRWWDNPEIQRPLLSIVAVHAEDPFESTRPEQGVLIRVRCAWSHTNHGLLKQPISEFLALSIDDAEVRPELFSKRRPNGLYEDYYHYVNPRNLSPGRHKGSAVAKVVASNEEVRRTVEFVA